MEGTLVRAANKGGFHEVIEKWLAGHEVETEIVISRKRKHIDGVRYSVVQKTTEPQGKHIVCHNTHI